MDLRRDVFVPMRDGVRLAMDIYDPGRGGRHPVILTRTPYLKESPFATSWVRSLVEAGYVVVVSDARGTGFSEGAYDYYNCQGGPFDGYDTIEWIASEPWCDGNVGIMGTSAMAVYCYLAAITRPPHLKAMAPNAHPADFYFDQWFVGGVFRYQNRMNWALGSLLPRTLPVAPGALEDEAFDSKRTVQEGRFEQAYRRIAQGKSPIDLDWLADMYGRKTYSSFWRDLSIAKHHDTIDIPTFNGGSWHEHFVRGTLSSHEALDVPKKLLVSLGGPPGSAPETGDGGLVDSQRRWFDYYLRGVENGIVAEPAVRLYLMGAERWIDETDWPLPSDEASFFLRGSPGGGAASLNDGILDSEPPGHEEPDRLDHDPGNPNRTPVSAFDQRSFEARSLSFTTPPLEHDLEVVGSSRLVLHTSSQAKDVDWCVRLCDVFPDGRSRLLNYGALKGSHVASHEHPEALERDRVYAFEIEIWAMANLFRKGHRIRVAISNSDFPAFESNPIPSRNLVYHDAAYPSRLVLPVVRR